MSRQRSPVSVRASICGEALPVLAHDICYIMSHIANQRRRRNQPSFRSMSLLDWKTVHLPASLLLNSSSLGFPILFIHFPYMRPARTARKPPLLWGLTRYQSMGGIKFRDPPNTCHRDDVAALSLRWG